MKKVKRIKRKKTINEASPSWDGDVPAATGYDDESVFDEISPSFLSTSAEVYEVTRDTEVELNGNRYLLEKGDKIKIESRN